jgi:hypothetical protein
MRPRQITIEERRARLVSRHHLVPDQRSDDVVKICENLVGFHSSDPTTVYLSAAARMLSPSVQPVQHALYIDRLLVRHHAMRRTLWVHTIPQALTARAATTMRYVESERVRVVKMLEDHAGIADGSVWLERATQTVVETLASNPGLSTRQLGDILPDLKVPIVLSRGKSYEGTQSALSRVMLQLGFEGIVARTEPVGSWNNSQYRWELMKDWLPEGWGDVIPAEARRALVSRWLRSYGPGSERDIAWWTGLPLGLTRSALEDCGAVQIAFEGQPLWGDSDDQDFETGTQSSVALLPGLDPTTMGWKYRDWYLDPEDAKLLFDSNGNGGPTIWVDGEIVGGWAQGNDGSVRLHFTRDVGTEARAGVEERAQMLEKLWGTKSFKVRFPAPLQKILL